jgi:hypothetical protein
MPNETYYYCGGTCLPRSLRSTVSAIALYERKGNSHESKFIKRPKHDSHVARRSCISNNKCRNALPIVIRPQVRLQARRVNRENMERREDSRKRRRKDRHTRTENKRFIHVSFCLGTGLFSVNCLFCPSPVSLFLRCLFPVPSSCP